MSQRCRDLAAASGIQTQLRTRVLRVRHDGRRANAVEVAGPDRRVHQQPCGWLISSMPLGDGRHKLPVTGKLLTAIGKTDGDTVIVHLTERLP